MSNTNNQVSLPDLSEAPLPLRYSSCLCAIQHFETFFAYYSQSGCVLFESECRDAAGAVAEQILSFTTDDPVFLMEIGLDSLQEQIYIVSLGISLNGRLEAQSYLMIH